MILQQRNGLIKLPSPQDEGSMSLESALAQRRSLREFDRRELTLAEIGQILGSVVNLLLNVIS